MNFCPLSRLWLTMSPPDRCSLLDEWTGLRLRVADAMSREADKKLQRQLSSSSEFSQRSRESNRVTQSLQWGTAPYAAGRTAHEINSALAKGNPGVLF